MATSPHRSGLAANEPAAQPGAFAHGWRAGWLWPVGALVAMALMVAAVVQWQQMSLLRPTVAFDSNALVEATFRAEVEYWRLRERWPVAGQVLLDAQDESDKLPLRYEIFVSRVGLMHDGAHKRLLQNNPEIMAAVALAQDFIAQADPVFQAAQTGAALDVRQLVALRPQLVALGPSIHAMALRAAHHVAQQTTMRQQAVQQHNVVSIALTVFLSVLMLTFAFIAFRQLRRLDQRRQRLEELSHWLRESQREAHAANTAKSAFLANMSHEIRTPFQGLLGMLSLLEETGLNPRQHDLLGTATESADHLLQILNDILDMSQLESGRLSLLPADVDVRGLVHGVEALMRPQALRKGLALHITVAPGVPERARLDATRVKQVLFNLITNAVKFADAGAVHVELLCTEQPAGGASDLRFVISDSGMGMDVTTLAGLFKRFNQGDNSSSRRYGGTGLGLEISRDLARLMGGDITVESHIGVGSVFTFHMPWIKAFAPAPEAVGPRSAAHHAVRSHKLLVAEDHAINRQYLAAVLGGMGHSATFAANGQEAVLALQRERFDAVLMDLHMPVMDGVAATVAIRALHDAAKAAVPIVALTADAFETTRERCLLAGMNDFLSKPIGHDALASCLRRLLGDGHADHDPVSATQGFNAATSHAGLPTGPRHALSSGVALLNHNTINLALQSMPRERFTALLQDYLDDAPHTVARLRAAMRDARTLDLQVNAHATRGAALNLGLAALASTAAALHEGAVHLPAHEIVLLVQRFDEQLQQSAAALRDMGLLAERSPKQ